MYENGNYLIGYAIFRKERCEIHNFISPTLRILRFLEGDADWRINDRVRRFRAGDVMLLNNVSRRNVHQMHSDCIRYEMFDFYPAIFSDHRLSNIFYGKQNLVFSEVPERMKRLHGLLDALRDEMLHEDGLYRNDCLRNLTELLAVSFARCLPPPDMPEDSAFYRLSGNLQYITEHISEPLTVAELATKCGYTVEHYSRLFKRYFGMTPIRYITTTRLDNVIFLVLNRHMSVLEAAGLSGYQSSSAFYKSFRSFYDMTPTEYISSHYPAELIDP